MKNFTTSFSGPTDMLYQKKVDEIKNVKFKECIFGSDFLNFVEKTFIFTFKKMLNRTYLKKKIT